MSKKPHLWCRNGYFYFRIAIPVRLEKRFGCKELSCSLRTRNEFKAKYRCLKLLEVVQYVFMALEQDERLKPEQVREIVRSYFKEALARLEQQFEATNNQSKILKSVRKSIEHNTGSQIGLEVFSENNMADRFDYLVPAHYNSPVDESGERVSSYFSPFFFDGNFDEILKYVIEENDLDIEEDTLAYRALLNGINRAVKELSYQHKQRVDFEPNIQIKDDWFKGHIEDVVSLKGDEKITISVAFSKYLEGIKGLNIRAKEKNEAAISQWLEIIGDTPIGLVDKKKVRQFIETLQKLPSNMKKRYPGKTVEEILNLGVPEGELLKNKTINGYLTPLRTFMDKYVLRRYKIRNGENPFANMSLEKEGDEEDLKDPFSEEQLVGIFSSPVYQGCKGIRPTQKYKKGNLIIKDSMFWVPLIALYSGARLSEILQLHMTDVYKVGKTWVFDFNDNGSDKSLKTKTSKRIIPIHSKIIDMGFLEYFKEVKGKGKNRIFYDVEMSSNGSYSSNFSKSFSYFLKKFKLKTDLTSFHSFRHNVADVFRFCDQVDEETSNAITGHKTIGTKSIYGSGKRTPENLKKYVPKLAKAMKHLQYPFLDKVLK